MQKKPENTNITITIPADGIISGLKEAYTELGIPHLEDSSAWMTIAHDIASKLLLGFGVDIADQVEKVVESSLAAGSILRNVDKEIVSDILWTKTYPAIHHSDAKFSTIINHAASKIAQFSNWDREERKKLKSDLTTLAERTHIPREIEISCIQLLEKAYAIEILHALMIRPNLKDLYDQAFSIVEFIDLFGIKKIYVAQKESVAPEFEKMRRADKDRAIHSALVRRFDGQVATISLIPKSSKTISHYWVQPLTYKHGVKGVLPFSMKTKFYLPFSSI